MPLGIDTNGIDGWSFAWDTTSVTDGPIMFPQKPCHELRNPLGRMRPSLYLLQKNLPTEDKRLIGAFVRLDRSINRCDQIIDQMLDFIRVHNIDTQILDLDDWLAQELDEMGVPDGIRVAREFGLNHKLIGFDPA